MKRFLAASALALVLAPCAALADGDGRDANAAEQAFSLKLRQAAQAALARIAGTEWVASLEEVKADTWVGIDAAKQPYTVNYQASFQALPESARGQRLAKEYEALTSNPGGPPPDFVPRMRKLQGEQTVSFMIEFNPGQAGLTIMDGSGGSWQAIKVPGTTHATRASHVQMLSGGGDDSSVDATALYLGPWTKPAVGEYGAIVAQPQRKPGAPYLSVQQVYLRIEAPPALADEMIQRLDLGVLNALIH
ncbi:MAG TPA: hypothetical protein VM074_05360 [Solimonas sp.]|nr:hypothetical protein [Solimonas sp.]